MDRRPGSWAILTLAGLAVLTAMKLAAGLLVPLVLSVLAAFALDPVVVGIRRLVRSRALASALAMLGLVAMLGGAAYALSDDVAAAAAKLPEATASLRRAIGSLQRSPASPLDAIGRAADNLEAAASEATGRRPAAADRGWDGLGLRDWLVVGSMSVVGLTGELVLLVFLVYFLLASGDLFKRKVVHLATTWRGRRNVVALLGDIHHTLRRFVLVVLATNLLVAAASFVAFRAIGLSNAAAWAVVAGVLNTIPYVGPTTTTVVVYLVALLQYDRFDMAALAAGLFIAIVTVEGTVLKPIWMSRMGRLNNVAVFTGLLVLGWLWGAWGMLLAYPILMVVKTVADHVEDLAPIGALLGS